MQYFVGFFMERRRFLNGTGHFMISLLALPKGGCLDIT